MHEKLKQILENTEHPRARAILENILDSHDVIIEQLYANARDRIIEKKEQIWFDGESEQWIEFGDDLAELSHELLDKYHQKASGQLRRGTYAKRTDNIKTATRKRVNRLHGVKKASSVLTVCGKT